MSDHSLRRTLDWRFLAMLAFLLMVAYLVVTGVSAIQQNSEKGHQIDALITAAQQADADATRQRDDLLAAQRVLLSRIDAYDARQQALLQYLRKHGIDIPTRFVEVPVGRLMSRSGPGRPGVGVPGVPVTTPPPGVAAPPSPASGPGRSGEHRHQPKKPHKQ